MIKKNKFLYFFIIKKNRKKKIGFFYFYFCFFFCCPPPPRVRGGIKQDFGCLECREWFRLVLFIQFFLGYKTSYANNFMHNRLLIFTHF